MLDGIPDSYQKTIGYPTYDLTRAFAIGAEALADEIRQEAAKLNVDNLSGDDLTRFVYQFRGIPRRQATHAVGVVTVTGYGTVSESDLFETKGAVQFVATKTVKIRDSGTVPVRALLTGSVGNVPEQTITEIPVTIPGIVTVTNAAATTGGYAEETDEALRERYYLNVREPPTSGNIAHYKAWALSVPGVGGVKVFPLAHGNWTVDVVIISDKHEAADPELVQKVQTYIDPESTGLGDGVAPIGAHCYVESAKPLQIDVSARVVLSAPENAEQVKEAVTETLKKFFAGLPFDNKNPSYVSHARIGAALLDVPDILDYRELLLNEQAANLKPNDREIAVLGEVTLNVVE
jgi:uncharacterized phage protein gp47/JayE|nr:MAG TPA: Baseplate J like protein [Caudoviricetes sp.]